MRRFWVVLVAVALGGGLLGARVVVAGGGTAPVKPDANLTRLARAAAVALRQPELAFAKCTTTSTSVEDGCTALSPTLWTVNLDGTGETALAPFSSARPGESGPAYSPDGKRIAFSVSGRIAVADQDGTNARFITNPGTLTPEPGVDRKPAWSPDGTHIALSRVFPGNDSPDAAQIVIVAADGSGDDHPVLASVPCPGGSSPCFETDPTFSPVVRNSVQTLAFSAKETVNSDFQSIYTTTVDFGTTPPQVATARNISSDVLCTPPIQIQVAALRTRPATVPECNAFDDDGPDWSPAGDAIVFARHTGAFEGSTDEILRINLTDPSLNEIIFDTVPPGSPAPAPPVRQPLANPAYTPDGSQVVFAGTTGSGSFPTLLLWRIAVPASGGTGTGTPQVLIDDRTVADDEPVFHPIADLSVESVTASATPIALGDRVTVTMTVANAGPYTAPNTLVEFALPAGLAQDGAATPSQGTCPSTGTRCNLGTLGVGAEATVTIPLRATAVGTQTVTGRIVGSDRFDPTPGDSKSTTIEVRRPADVVVSVSAPPQVPAGGDPFVVQYRVTNAGDFTATNVRLTVGLPPQLPIDSVTTSAGSCPAQPTAVCTLGDVAAQGTVTVSFTLEPAVALSAVLTGLVAADVDDPSNDFASTPLTVVGPNLSVQVAVDPEPAAQGGPPVAVTYTVTNNNAELPVFGVTLTVGLPAQLPVDSVTTPAGVTCPVPPATGCTLGRLDAGQSVTITFRLRPVVPVDTTVTGTATANVETPANTATAVLRVLAPNLAVAVTVNPEPAAQGGDPVTVTYTVTNHNEVPAFGVTLTVSLPPQLPIVGVTTTAGSCPNGPDAVCALGDIPAGGSVTVTFTLRPDLPVDTVVTGRASANVETADNTASAPLRVLAPNLALTLLVVPAQGVVGGDPVVVIYTVTNLGPFPTTGVRLTVGLPTQLPVLSVNPPGACQPAGCDLGTLAPGEVRTISFVLSPAQAVTALVSGVVTETFPDADPTDNTRTALLTLFLPDVSVTVAVRPVPGFVGGDPIAVTYTVLNKSPFPVRAVTLAAGLPAQLPAATTDPACTVRPVPVCRLATLAPGQPVLLRFTLTPAVGLTATVTGTVTEVVPDGFPLDNLAVAQVRVLAPSIRIDPVLGPPGFVPQVTGRDFPAGVKLRLTWSQGLMSVTAPVQVRPDGTFAIPVLVFHKDQLGVRVLTATLVPGTGPAFGPVNSPPYLVVPGVIQPPDFVIRR